MTDFSKILNPDALIEKALRAEFEVWLQTFMKQNNFKYSNSKPTISAFKEIPESTKTISAIQGKPYKTMPASAYQGRPPTPTKAIDIETGYETTFASRGLAAFEYGIDRMQVYNYINKNKPIISPKDGKSYIFKNA